MSARVWIVAEGVPVPQGSSRAFMRGGRIVVTSDNKNLKSWRELVSAEARMVAPAKPWEGPVAVILDFWLPYPASGPKRVRQAPTKRPDLDKLIRAALDSLSGIIFRDDSQVASIAAYKSYAADGRSPGVEIVASNLEA